MKMIVGLGNPGKEYEHTRHNVGFRCLDALVQRLEVSFDKSQGKAIICKTSYKGESVLLVKPQTYMNSSGDAVSALCNFYKIAPSDIIVIYDDMDFEVGVFKLRFKGSDGGHNGIKSIIAQLGTSEIKRIRVGIGKRGNIAGADYVLGKFKKDEEKILEETWISITDALLDFISEPFEKVMNKHNK